MFWIPLGSVSLILVCDRKWLTLGRKYSSTKFKNARFGFPKIWGFYVRSCLKFMHDALNQTMQSPTKFCIVKLWYVDESENGECCSVISSDLWALYLLHNSGKMISHIDKCKLQSRWDQTNLWHQILNEWWLTVLRKWTIAMQQESAVLWK
jgi:hypothetical protein